MAESTSGAESLALTVHGAAGVIDLVVPAGAFVADLAQEYATQSRLTAAPALFTRVGVALAPDEQLADSGVSTGAVLVAIAAEVNLARSPSLLAARTARRPRPSGPGALSALWFCVAAGGALLGAWLAARTDQSQVRDATIAILTAAAAVGVLPLGRFAGQRAITAPVFAGAAAFVVVWDPAPERLPTVVGVSALVAALAAGVARSLDRLAEEALRVWIVVGTLIFVVTAAGALLGFEPRVTWAVLLLMATLSARFVPGMAVDVPDQYLIDLERLAVTAWSARDRPRGRRGRIIVPPQAVALVATRGTRIITAAAAGVLVVVAISAPLLLATAPLPMDRIGARCMVGLCGASLFLAARSYRHVAARTMLRLAGLTCWASLLLVLLNLMSPPASAAVGLSAIGLAVLLVVVAVATGRGWRSAWWSRRAEVAEGLTTSFAIGSLFVAVGLFRHLWESTG